MSFVALSVLNEDLLRNLLQRPPLDAVEPSYRFLDWLGPRYQFVTYRGKLDRVDYERPETFYGLGETSPSDSRWMIPCGLEAIEQPTRR